MSFSCLLDEGSMSSGGSIQAVRQSSLAVIRQHESTALNRDSRPRLAALHGPHGGGATAPNTLLVRAWRSLIELRIDDALATVAQFEDEIARAEAPVATRARVSAEVLRAVLLVLKSQDGATVRAPLAGLESRQRSGENRAALA